MLDIISVSSGLKSFFDVNDLVFLWSNAVVSAPGNSISNYEIQVAADGDFSSPDMLEFTVEAGAFSAQPLSYTVENIYSILYDDSYSWRIRAVDSDSNYGEWTVPSLDFAVSPAEAPLTDKNISQDGSVTLSWGVFSGYSTLSGAEYEIRVYSSQDLTGSYDTHVTSDATIALSGLSDSYYSWEVRRTDGDTPSPWLQGNSFYVDSTSPNVPFSFPGVAYIDYTPDGQTPIYVEFNWNANVTDNFGGYYYKLELSANSNFSASVSLDVDGASAVEFIMDSGSTGNQGMGLLSKLVQEAGSTTGTIYWRVHIYDTAGNLADTTISGSSFNWTTDGINATVITDAIPPPKVSGVKVATDGYGKLSVTWNASSDAQGIDKYEIKLTNSTTGTLVGTYYSTTTSSLIEAADGSYSIVVKAIDCAGYYSVASSTVNIVTTGRPEQMDSTSFYERLAGKDAIIMWSQASELVSGYTLRYSTSSDMSNSTEVKLNNAGTTKYTISGLNDGTYYYQIAAFLGNGTGNWSATTAFSVDNSGDAGNTKAQAAALTTAESKREYVGGSDAADFFKITPTGTGRFTLGVSCTYGTAVSALVMNEAGKTIYSFSSNLGGTFSQYEVLLLEDANYYVRVLSTSSIAEYVIAASATYFNANNADDNYLTLTEAYTLEIDNGNLSAGQSQMITDEWVGFGDKIDYRLLDFNETGAGVNFTLSTAGMEEDGIKTAALKFSVWSLNANNTLRLVKTVSTSPRLLNEVWIGTSVSTGTLLLDKNKTYYISVESASSSAYTAAGYGNGSLAVNGEYGIAISGEYFDSADNTDDTWTSTASSISLSEHTTDGVVSYSQANWIGFGDATDANMVTVAEAGRYTISIAGMSEKMNIYLYKTNALGNGLVLIKSIAYNPAASVPSTSITGQLLAAGNYYVLVKAAGINLSKNISGATDYSLSITGTVYVDADNTDDTWMKARDNGRNVNLTSGSVTVLNENWIGFGDTADYMKLTVTGAGSYNFSINGLEQAAEKLKMTLISITNGSTRKQLASITVSGSMFSESVDAVSFAKDILLTPADNVQYYLAVESLSATAGYDTTYTVTANSAIYTEIAGFDNADDTYSGAAPTTISALAGGVTGWAGFGDNKDFFKFTVSEEEADSYIFKLKDDSDVLKKGSLRLTVYRVYDDGKIGSEPILTVNPAASTSSLTLTELEGYYYAQTKALSLLAGTYVVKVETSGSGTRAVNTEYTLSVAKQETFTYVEDAGSSGLSVDINATTYVFTLDSYSDLAFGASISGLTLYQDNGKGGRSAISIKANNSLTLAAGTYYLAASTLSGTAALISRDIEVTDTENPAYADVTANAADNTWQTASALDVGNAEENWVGYGDGKDFYSFTVGGNEAGAYKINLAGVAASGYAKVTLYKTVVNSSAVQSLVAMASFTYSAALTAKNYISVANLFHGTYYVAVESTSCAVAATARNTDYTLTVTSESPYQLLSAEDTTLQKNEFAAFTLEGTSSAVYRVAFDGTGFALYTKNASGTLQSVTLTNNNGNIGVLLNGGTTYYVKSTLASNDLSYTATAINYVDSSMAVSFAAEDANVRTLQGDSAATELSGWIGLGDADDSYTFNTFSGGVESGWATFKISDMDNVLASTTKFTLSLYKEVNGSWLKVASKVASYVWNSKTSSYVLTSTDLSASLTVDTNYKLTVSTSDAGKGAGTGTYQITGSVDLYDYSNNSFQTAATIGDGEGHTYDFDDNGRYDATLAKAGDSVDFFDISDWGSFNLDVTEAGGKVSLAFYNENYEAVKVSDSVSNKTASSFTLPYNALLSDSEFNLEASSWSDSIKYVKIIAAGAANNHYSIGIS